ELSRIEIKEETGFKKWSLILVQQVQDICDRFFQIASWIDLLPVPQNLSRLNGLEEIPTLHNIVDRSGSYLKIILSYQQTELDDSSREWLTKARECILKAIIIADEEINLSDQLA